MFRPAPESPFFSIIPLRLIASVLLILAFAVSVLLLFSLEHEKFVVHGLTDGKTVPTELFQTFWQSRLDLITFTVLLFLVSAIGIVAVITFIHYQNTRRTLEEVKGLARNILQSIPTGVLTVNRDGLITAVNPTAERVLKRPSPALLGRTYQKVFTEDDPIRLVLDEALQAHRYVPHKDFSFGDGDRAVRTVRVSTVELADDEGQPAGVILQAQDVTEWLALEQQVWSAEKLSALHTLSAGVAHELRNPLSAVDLNLHLLDEELREKSRLSPRAVQYLEVLNAETRRLSGILDHFMKFARPGTVHRRKVDVQGVIAHIVSLLQYEAEEQGIHLETSPAEGLSCVFGDETQIGQVLVNVVVNAFHAMPSGGTCRIAAAPRATAGRDWVEISVHDTGIGIKREALHRLFEPFYTTKANGSGLGLAIAYRIIQDHGGTIEVMSTPGTGTTVVVKLPAASSRHHASTVGA